MDKQAELMRERRYAERVKELLCQIIAQSQGFSDQHDSTINMLLSDAWEELRLKPTALSVTDLDTLGHELNRVQLRQSLSKDVCRRSEKMLEEPFFARVNFKEDGETQTEKIVIGLYSLKDDKGALLVHDWRAPIASLYYDAMPGKVSYEAPEGEITGEMRLKRQYRFEDGELAYYVDTDVCIDDSVLLDILSGATSSHMRLIVSTIQKEQNRAIRFDKAKVLAVVGGAGSGKTSVAMHRAAYLMFRQRDTLSASSIAILAPTSAFSEYISGVLPDLGEENAQALVLHKVYTDVIGLTPEPPIKQLERLAQPGYTLRRDSVGYKAGADFVNLLERFVLTFKIHGPAFEDIGFEGNQLVTKQELEHMYRSEFRMLSPMLRLIRIQTLLQSRMALWEKSLEGKYQEQFHGKYRGKALELAARMAVSQRLSPLRTSIRRMLSVNPLLLYADALRDIPEKLYDAARENAAAQLIWFEDAPAIAYLMLRLGFAQPDRNIKQLMVDEAQDYSFIALAFLHVNYPMAQVTLLGDPNQRTSPGMPGLNPEGWGQCFELPSAPVVQLTRCYRSTAQITRLCNALLPEGVHVEAFGREGVTPLLASYTPEVLDSTLLRFKNAGYAHIALITRALPEAQQLAKQIPGAWLIEDEGDMMPEAGGVVVSCYHLMKGLEFDAVVVVWPKCTLDDGERRRLYTACSRALHDLALLPELSILEQLGLVL